MKKYFALLFLFSAWATASVIYYGSGEGVLLENRLKFKNGTTKETGSTTPTSGLTRATGSTYQKDDGTLWIKQYGANTQWARVATASELGSYVLKAGDTMTGPLLIDKSSGNHLEFQLSGTTKIGIGSNGSLPSIFGGSGVSSPSSGTFIDLSDDSGMNLRFARASNSMSGAASAFIARRSRGTTASPTIINDGDRISQFNSQGYDGASFIGSQSLETYADGTPATNSVPIRATFNNATSGSTRTDRFHVRGDGRIQMIDSNTLPTDTAKVFINGATASSVQLKIKGATSQSGNLLTNADSSDTYLSGFDSSGFLRYPDTSATSAAAPQIYFVTGSNKTGIGYNSAGVNSELFFTTNGSSRMSMSAAGTVLTNQLFANGNGASAPALTLAVSDSNTGVAYVAADSMCLSTGGTCRISANNTDSTISNNLVVTGSTTLATTLNGGVLKATSGVVATGTVNLASTSEVTGTLGIPRGGTATASIVNGAVVVATGSAYGYITGTSGQVLKHDGNQWVAGTVSASVTRNVATLTDEKGSGTGGGGVTAGVWTDRVLNTRVESGSFILNPSAFTGQDGSNTSIDLPAGTYYMDCMIPSYFNGSATPKSTSKLINKTLGTDIATASAFTVNVSGSADGSGLMSLKKIFTLASGSTIRLQTYVDDTLASNGLGFAYGLAGKAEVYTTCFLEKY